jgi:hypothetical protein
MTTILPHTGALRQQIVDYLDEVVTLAGDYSTALAKSGAFTSLFKTTLAGDTVLAKLSSTEKPRLAAARSILRRIPILIAVGQIRAADGYVRKLIEVIFLCMYFTDHPVEWLEFTTSAASGISREFSTPIAYNARREPSFYANYTKELFRKEPSGLAQSAAQDLSVAYGDLSVSVHAAAPSVQGKLSEAHDPVDEASLHAFAETYKRSAADVSVLVAARFQRKFDRLPPVHRAWFDWLIGKDRAKRLRTGRFGLPPLA